MSVSELGLLRLVALGLAGPPAATVADATARLTAVQAQDLPGAIISLALRVEGRSRDAVGSAFDAGEIVRSWPMRGTLHVVPAADLGWMLELGAPRPIAAAAARRAQLGLTGANIDLAHEIALTTVPATREELFAVWEDAGLAPAGGRGYHLLALLAMTGVLCFGPTRDGAPVIVAIEDWITHPRRLDREEALGEWARRFFHGHGPATVADCVRWTGLPVAEARAGVAVARPDLASMDVDGTEFLLDPAVPDRLAEHRRAARAAHLLPGFDEFVLGYRDRSAVLAPEFADRIVPGGNGVFRPTLVVGGRVVATWKVVGRQLAIDPFRPLDARTTTAAQKAHARLP